VHNIEKFETTYQEVSLKQALRVATLLGSVCAVLISLSGTAVAQRFDVAVGGGRMAAPPASQADNHHSPESLDGGTYFSASGDMLIHKIIGVQAETAWRGSRAIYYPGGYNQPYRPFYYDVNALLAPKINNRLTVEFLAGVGIQNTRFYKGTQACTYVSCIKFVSSNHFMEHFGGGLKVYAFHKLFVRPEAHLYWVNNNVEFSSARVVRYAVSVGYSF
jgi:hypothetical protein